MGNKTSQASQPTEPTPLLEPSTFRVRFVSQVTIHAMTSTKMPSSTTVLEICSKMLKKPAKEQALQDFWNKFLFGNKRDVSVSKDKEIKEVKRWRV